MRRRGDRQTKGSEGGRVRKCGEGGEGEGECIYYPQVGFLPSPLHPLFARPKLAAESCQSVLFVYRRGYFLSIHTYISSIISPFLALVFKMKCSHCCWYGFLSVSAPMSKKQKGGGERVSVVCRMDSGSWVPSSGHRNAM